MKKIIANLVSFIFEMIDLIFWCLFLFMLLFIVAVALYTFGWQLLAAIILIPIIFFGFYFIYDGIRYIYEWSQKNK